MIPFLPVAALPLLQFAEIGQMLADFAFVIQVMTFAYVLFWLFMTFRDVPLLFGLTSIVAAYFMFIQPLPVMLLIVVFFAFFLFGNQLQMLILFGLEPILGVFGQGKYAQQYEMEYMAELQNKVSQGHELSAAEMDAFQKYQEKQQVMGQGGGNVSQELGRRRMMHG